MPALQYQSGFGNEFATEALAGALPQGQNSPQRCAYGLYAEQISGTVFTSPRGVNRRTWIYRIRPSALHQPFRALAPGMLTNIYDGGLTPNQCRWDPWPQPSARTDFIDGLVTVGGNGDPGDQSGCGIHIYAANQSMQDRFFYNADGDMLLLPQEGRLRVATEMGVLEVEPQELLVLPRGVRFQVALPDGVGRGYACESFGGPFRLPELGPIGSNGLANPRDFLAPVAAYQDRQGKFELLAKFGGRMWAAEISHSPLDVVAWHGNYAPCKYDLRRFNALGSIGFDHPDPSIFTVLQSPGEAGLAMVDLLVFPPRWQVSEQSFRPPWFHRNVASEFMGLICGTYDARAQGFTPGGASLHNCMSGHGPDAEAFEKASVAELLPERIAGSLAFMFETRLPIRLTRHALDAAGLQPEYYQTWQGLKRNFDSDRR